MSSRTEFTIALANLISQMELNGDKPILDYVKRSAEEQRRLFDKGLSKCDGVNKVSAHQIGRAADIYLDNNGSIEWTEEKANYYHEIWSNMGGRAAISWDLGHFEMP
jgi:hypothetical protein